MSAPAKNSRPLRSALVKATRRATKISCAVASVAVVSSAQEAWALGPKMTPLACDGTLHSGNDVVFEMKQGDVFTAVGGDVSYAVSMSGGFTNDTIVGGNEFTVPLIYDGAVGIFMPRSAASKIKCERRSTIVPPVDDGTTNIDTIAMASVTVQAGVTQTAINTNVTGRFGGSGLSTNQNGFTISTRGLDTAASDLGEPELNAWVGVERRRYSGNTTGGSSNLTFGLDRLLNPNTVIGGYVSYNDQTATVAGTTTDTKSPVFGVYAARKLNNGLFASGFVGAGRPKYSTSTTDFTATRSMLGLSVSGQFEAYGFRLKPLASLLASREDLPAVGTLAADRLENIQAIASLRAEPLQRMANGALPYLTLGAEYRRQGSDNAGFDTFTKPRIGLGVDWQLAAGTLRFDMDYGALNSNSNDFGASVIYDFKF